MDDLDTLFQISTATLFPEKDKIAEVVKNRFRSSAYATKEVSIRNEIESFFSRIDYELKMLRIKGETTNKKNIMRWLRKEQDDLINYVEQQMKSHSAESKRDDQETDLKKIRKDIQDNFQVLLIRYKEV